ncbi:MAG: dihydroorotate dehydrogenase electron transfer subunit [Candidatus Omnitrophota bacterium]
MKQEYISVRSNRYLGNVYYLMSLASRSIAVSAKPGQFIHIRCSQNNVPLIRRPFSIHSVMSQKGTFEILYEVKGTGTGILSGKKPGDTVDVIGPLGNGFDIKKAKEKSPPLLVGGGMGIAPLLFLAQALARHDATVLIGAKTTKQILCEKDFKDVCRFVNIATDDKSAGFGGYVSDLLKKEIFPLKSRPSVIYACGPHALLKKVAKLAKQYKIECQVSLETFFTCGVGACLGCAVKTIYGYRLACKDGPIFNAEEVLWE